MSDDPFAEPSDSEATIIRPRPGGRGAGAGPAPGPARAAPATAVPAVGASPLLAAAAPVLAAAVRIGAARATPPDPEQLRRAMVEAVREFEKRALATGLDTRSLRAARYALCATIDDLVLSTPWGSTSTWGAQSLTSIFHNEVSGGERFFDILEDMQKDLGRHAEVVELMYFCASLGFEGRYRVMPRGIAALTEIARFGLPHHPPAPRRFRARPVAALEGAQPRPQAAGADCAGVDAGHDHPRHRLPDLRAVQLLARRRLRRGLCRVGGAAAERRDRGAAAGPGGPAATAAAGARRGGPRGDADPGQIPGARDQGRPGAGVRGRAVDHRAADQPPDVRLRLGHPQRELFPLLHRIGTALRAQKGDIIVDGYTDNQPIHTVQFPSNWQLSQARALAVAKVLRVSLADPQRLRAVGKGDADPIAPNTTPQGRDQNRRTEVVLLKTSNLP